MKLPHIVVGVVVLVAFLLTGQYMNYLDVRSGVMGEGARMMFRSRHIYLLLAGLVNLGIGAYITRRAGGWRKVVQLAGTVLVLVAPALLLAGFISEPALPGLRRHFTLPGIVILAVGTLFHALSGIGAGRAESAQPAQTEHAEVVLTD